MKPIDKIIYKNINDDIIVFLSYIEELKQDNNTIKDLYEIMGIIKKARKEKYKQKFKIKHINELIKTFAYIIIKKDLLKNDKKHQKIFLQISINFLDNLLLDNNPKEFWIRKHLLKIRKHLLNNI